MTTPRCLKQPSVPAGELSRKTHRSGRSAPGVWSATSPNFLQQALLTLFVLFRNQLPYEPSPQGIEMSETFVYFLSFSVFLPSLL